MNPYLMPSVEFGPLAALRILEKVPAGRYDEVLEPGRFSAREAISHLADWEPFWLERFKVGMETPGGRIVAYDEGQMAIDREYSKRDPISEAKRYIAGRKIVADYLRAFKPEDFKKTIDHPERGVLTLEDMANMLLGHDMYHLEHLTQYL